MIVTKIADLAEEVKEENITVHNILMIVAFAAHTGTEERLLEIMLGFNSETLIYAKAEGYISPN